MMSMYAEPYILLSQPASYVCCLLTRMGDVWMGREAEVSEGEMTDEGKRTGGGAVGLKRV